MLSRSTLELLDAIAQAGSFSGAAILLNKVPSAVSHAVKQLEERLGVSLFERGHTSATLTPAGEYIVVKARLMLKDMDAIEANVVRVAKGWNPSLTIAVDVILRSDQVHRLIADFHRQFDDVELTVRLEVFNGVWDALLTGRADIAIGATTAIPVDGGFDHKDMGAVDWVFVVGKDHPLGEYTSDLDDCDLIKFPSICLEDTSSEIPRRRTWALPNQRKLVVANWEQALEAAKSGAGIGYFPRHVALPSIAQGDVLLKVLRDPKPPSPCCLAWRTDSQSPVQIWVLNYLGDATRLQAQWIVSP